MVVSDILNICVPLRDMPATVLRVGDRVLVFGEARSLWIIHMWTDSMVQCRRCRIDDRFIGRAGRCEEEGF